MKNKIIGVFSLMILLLSLIITPKVEAFDPGDIIITCGSRDTLCFRYADDSIDIEIMGGIDDIIFE